MCEKMPFGGFEWIENVDIENYNVDGDKGCFVEVDLEYPKELHDLHNDYPLAPESRSIHYNELSKYQKNQLETHHENKMIKLIISSKST